MPRSTPPEASGFFDLLRQVLDDVRHRVVEEGWFGRPVTGDLAPPSAPETQPTIWEGPPMISFEEQWAVHITTEAAPTAPEPPGLDR